MQPKRLDAFGTAAPVITHVDRPTFQIFDTENNPPSVANLPRDLTINGITVSPTFFYKGEDASSPNWVAEVGETLTEAGAGASPSYDQDTPLMGSDRGVLYNAAKHHVSSTAFAEVTTEDFVVEIVYKHGTATSGRILSTRATGVGYVVYRASDTAVGLYMSDGSSSVAITSSPSLTIGACYHGLCFVDRSGYGQWYINGVANGSAADVSGVGSLASGLDLSLGADPTAANPLATVVIAAALWRHSSWLDTHLQDTLAADRFRRLIGVHPQVAAGDPVPLGAARNCVAHLDKYDSASGERRLFLVGNHWLRTCRRQDANGDVGDYYVPEAARTNSQVYSERLDAADWSKVNCSITNTTTTTLPNLETSSYDVIHEDATAGAAHYINDGNSVESGKQYTLSVFVKAINRDWIQLGFNRSSGGNVRCKFDLTNGAVGGSAAIDAASIEDWGNGWYRCRMTFTANDTESNALVIILCGDGGVTTFDGLDQDSLFVWGVQFEQGAHPSSYIRTEAAAVTRLADQLRFEGLANLGGTGSEQQGALVCDVLLPEYLAGIGGFFVDITDGGSTGDRMYFHHHTNDAVRFVVNAGGGEQAVISSTTHIADNIKHTIATRWKTNNIGSIVVDGTEEGSTDTSCTIPDELDRIDVGSTLAFTYILNGGLRNLRIYRRYQHSVKRLAGS